MPLLVLLIADEQIVVAAIRLPGYVRHIPDDRYGTEGVLDGQVEHHAKYRNARRPAFPCRKYNEEGCYGCEGIAYSRNPPDERV